MLKKPPCRCMLNIRTNRECSPKDVVPQSNYGSWVEIYAPFNNVLATPVPGISTPYSWFGGTCAASPFVAGVGAMIKYVNPGISLNDLRSILVFNKCNTRNDPRIGSIRYVNAYKAVRESASRAGLSPAGDSFEPDDTEDQAVTINPGTISATIFPGDVDFYTFSTSDFTDLQLTVNFLEKTSAINRLYASLDGTYGTDSVGSVGFGQTMLPPGTHILRVWGGSEAINCYIVQFSSTVSAISPDRYDDETPAGEQRNDSFNTAAVIPDIVKPYGLLYSLLINGLNHDTTGDTDFFTIQLDQAQGPFGEPECCGTLDQYTTQGRLQLTVEPHFSVIRPFDINVYTSTGSLLGTRHGLDYVLECPHDQFPDGRITFSVHDPAGRNFYDISLFYTRCNTRILPDWTLEYERPPFYREIPDFLGTTRWIFPGDPAIRDRVFSGEQIEDFSPEYLIFDQSASGPYVMDFVFPAGGDLEITLLDQQGEVVSTAAWPEEMPFKRLKVEALMPGTYFIRIKGQQFGVPCMLSNMATDAGQVAAEFGQTGCSGSCMSDFDHDNDVDSMDLVEFAAEF